MKAKKKFVCRSAFFQLPPSLNLEPTIVLEIAHKKVTKLEIIYILISWSMIKASGTNRISF